MVITLSKIFRAAHLNAKKLRERFDGYREAFSFALRAVWQNAKRMIEDACYSDEVKEAAKMIKSAHHFEGRSRKVESKISWKLDQMLSTYADKQAARRYAEILESREALDPRNFFSPRIPEGKLA